MRAASALVVGAASLCVAHCRRRSGSVEEGHAAPATASLLETDAALPFLALPVAAAAFVGSAELGSHPGGAAQGRSRVPARPPSVPGPVDVAPRSAAWGTQPPGGRPARGVSMRATEQWLQDWSAEQRLLERPFLSQLPPDWAEAVLEGSLRAMPPGLATEEMTANLKCDEEATISLRLAVASAVEGREDSKALSLMQAGDTFEHMFVPLGGQTFNGKVFTVNEVVDETLENMLEGGSTLPFSTSLQLLVDMLHGLQELRTHSLMLTDLSVEDVLIVQGRAVLAGLGRALPLQQTRDMSVTVGLLGRVFASMLLGTGGALNMVLGCMTTVVLGGADLEASVRHFLSQRGVDEGVAEIVAVMLDAPSATREGSVPIEEMVLKQATRLAEQYGVTLLSARDPATLPECVLQGEWQ